MNKFKKLLCLLLALVMAFHLFPVNAFAESDDIYTIQNDYIKYSINAKTGGFSVETLDGNPQKDLDNNIPLLYKEDSDRSNGTSFTTIRIDGKDYIFGRSYGFFGLSTEIGTPVVSEEGRLITVDWKIKDYLVTQQVAVSAAADADLTGNVGISYTVTNTGDETGNVGIRVLMDTALDSTVDAPYLVKDEGTLDDIIRTETEYVKGSEDFPSQIRGLDSLANPSKALYTFTKTFNNSAAQVDRVIVGHWRNLANTRYEYTPDPYCDFTNYSNKHYIPDAALAYYWNEAPLAAGESKVTEILYGVGNFSQSVEDSGIGIDMSIDNKIRLNEDGDGYVNDGEFGVTVVVDNSVSDAQKFSEVNVALSFDDGISSTDSYLYQQFTDISIGDVKTLKFNLKAEKQQVITSKSVGVTLTGTQDIEGTDNAKVVTLNTHRTFIVPGISDDLPEVKVNSITPEIVFTEGEKTLTVSGDLAPLSALKGTDGWKLFLYHTTNGEQVEISNENVAFIDDTYSQLTFATDKTLTVGKYEVGFEFSSTELVNGFGVSKLKLGKTIEVSNNPIYRTRTYGLMALVRYNRNEYAFVPFADQYEYNNFLDGLGRNGGAYSDGNGYPDIYGNLIPPFKSREGMNEIEAMDLTDQEIILIMRGSFKESDDDSGKYYQASVDDGDIIINEILTYKGKTPLIIREEDGLYSVSGDGKLAVINSIDVWPGKWSYQVNKGTVTSLDSGNVKLPAENVNSLELTLGGVGYMVQSLGGFLIDIKYGIMSAERPIATDRTLIYGISFGGSISIPISASSSDDKDGNKKNDINSKDDKAVNQLKKADDEEDYSEDLKKLFAEDETEDSGTSNAGTMVNSNTAKSNTSKPESDFKRDTNLDSGLLSAAINDVRFGQMAEETDDGEVEITDTGFVGIDATVSLGLPKDVLGSLVSNAPGVYASLTINTIEHFYMLEAGLDIKMIQCEGVLSFMMTDVKGVEVVVPDSIQFYIRDGLKIPLVPPIFYMTGLGGGIDGLADTIGGEFSKLPPITLLLFTRLELVELLVGDFNLSLALTGISYDGAYSINTTLVSKPLKGGSDNKNDGGINGAKNSPKNPANKTQFVQTALDTLMSPITAQFGLSARWIDPICFKGYGNITVIGGLITGGATVSITDKSFHGYASLALCVPDFVPIVGGMELAGVEAAVSDKFIGANIRIIGIKLGFIYYWDGDFTFGSGINLMGIEAVEYSDYNSRAVYGTNLKKLSKKAATGIKLHATGQSVSYNFDLAGLDSAMIEIPFDASELPGVSDLTITNPDGQEIPLVEDDGNGNGTYLVQSREDGNFIYVSVTNKALLKSGTWMVTPKSEKLSIESFDIYSVEDIPELTGVSYTRGSDSTSFDLDVSWSLDGESDGGGYLDIYISKDKDILEKIKASNTQDFDPISRVELDDIKSGSQTVQIPGGMESGTYYVVAMLTNKAGGMSTAISATAFDFVNENLPLPIDGATLKYAGDGDIYVEIDDADAPDYTHYVVEVVAEDGSTLTNNINEFALGEDIFIGKEANLTPGSNYYVNVKTLKEEDKKYYYGTEIVKSDTITMPEIDKPVLVSVETNIEGPVTNEKTLEITYTFDRPVWMYTTINESTYNATNLKKEWTLSHELKDGKYVVDFTAYGANKDSVTGADFPEISNAVLGFEVDTTAPGLSVKKTALEALATDGDEKVVSQFGSNVVFADEEGNFTVEGITDYSATLTADGEPVEIGNNGIFTYSGKLPEGKTSQEILFKATDKVGNTAELLVYVLIKEQAVAESVAILVNGNKITKNDDGEAVITVKIGESVELSVVGYASDGTEIVIDDPVWEFLYEANLVGFSDGILVGRQAGEMAIKGGISNGSVTLMNETEETDLLLEDYVIVEVVPNPEGETTGGGGGGRVRKSFTITVEETENGEVTVSQNKVYSGNSLTITSLADEGYEIDEIIINGVNYGMSEIITIPAVMENISILAKFRPEWKNPFVDVKKGSWFYPYVRWAYESSIMNGTSDDTFSPDDALTRAMLVTILWRTEGKPYGGESGFEDVVADSYYAEAVAWAEKNGIVKGYSDVEFAPDDKILREQFAAIMYRYAVYKKYDVAIGEDTDLDFYDDSEEISEYAVEAMKYAVGSGLIKGKTDTTIDPLGNATRAESATILKRFAEANEKKE